MNNRIYAKPLSTGESASTLRKWDATPRRVVPRRFRLADLVDAWSIDVGANCTTTVSSLSGSVSNQC